ncbi:MAG: hypothetical protein Q9217_004316 [Psora testacea]
MATLHAALRSLGPIPYSSVPQDPPSAIKDFLQSAFKDAQTIIDSLPLPPPIPIDHLTNRPRSSTSASTASNVSGISSSSVRSDPLDPANTPLQKEWGKPIKLAPKDNPLNMSVYRLAGKDGKGAWFGRRSVHEGLGFRKWKLALEREFPETLQVQGGPGEGNIRGIGGERRVERRSVDGIGTVEVYHLSAQFPGPTTPRDFVTLLLTSSTALNHTAGSNTNPSASDLHPSKTSRFSETPRHFMVISRPCIHPECPPREGFIRGQYESVEFVREIPRKLRKSLSATDISRFGLTSPSMEKEAILRNALHQVKDSSESLPNGHPSSAGADTAVREGRQRGKTISFAGSRGPSAKGEQLDNAQDDDEDELNPVEWVMITRSDPGGSVPRFLVERGTPGGIVADASKFLDWACKKEYREDEVEALENGDITHIGAKRREDLEAYETNGHLAGIDGLNAFVQDTQSRPLERESTTEKPSLLQEKASEGVLASVTNVALSAIESYAPQPVIDRLPGHQPPHSISAGIEGGKDTSITNGVKNAVSTPSISSVSSIASFASAEERFDDTFSTKSATSVTKSSNSKSKMSPHQKELVRLNDRKRQLDEKLAKAKEKETKDKEELTSKEEERIRKAEEKHAKEVAKQEGKYKKEVARLEAKREKEAARDMDRKKKAEDKDEKMRVYREKEEMKQQLDMMTKERNILQEQVGALQKENTSLVVRLGKMDEGRDVLKEVKAEIMEGNRSRSGSLRRSKTATLEKGKQATVLVGGVGEKKENLEGPSLDCQTDLSASITKINKKSKLFVVREAPQTVLVKLFKAWNISHLVFEKDTDAYARDRDEDVLKQAKEAGVAVIVKMGRTLYDPDELVKANGGKPTMSITQVEHAAKKIGEVAKPIPAPSSLPDPGDTTISFPHNQPSPTPDFNNIQRDASDQSYNRLSGPNGDFAPPNMEELGLKEATTQHRGGETVALKALDRIIADADYTATFSKPATAPTAFSPQSTTLLSPHHHFGSLSVRLLYWRVMDLLKDYPKSKQSTIPTNLIGQLLFRDMYFAAQATLGYAFAQTVGNSHCKFIPWHLPSVVDTQSGLITGGYDIDTPEAEIWFQRWKWGKTGFPWIDAVMRQLRREGWIHHLARHAVACFLTRGGCYISWERGAEVFEEWLIDHEVACNTGNWQWLGCTAFYAQFYRCYSPIAFPKKTDPNGDFVRHFVPELKHYPAKYIYEPWRAPIADQKKAGCWITGDGQVREEEGGGGGGGGEGDMMQIYPKPMFDFNQRRSICIEAMKNAYHVNLYGDNPKVLNGTWRELFADSAEGPTEGKSNYDNDEEEGDAALNGRKRVKSGEEAADGDMGQDQDADEAAELGGETRGGDRTQRSPVVKGEEKKKKKKEKKGGQGTLDGLFRRERKKVKI